MDGSPGKGHLPGDGQARLQESARREDGGSLGAKGSRRHPERVLVPGVPPLAPDQPAQAPDELALLREVADTAAELLNVLEDGANEVERLPFEEAALEALDAWRNACRA